MVFLYCTTHINIRRTELEKKYWLNLENLLPNSNVHLHNMYKLGTIHIGRLNLRGGERSKFCQNCRQLARFFGHWGWCKKTKNKIQKTFVDGPSQFTTMTTAC